MQLRMREQLEACLGLGHSLPSLTDIRKTTSQHRHTAAADDDALPPRIVVHVLGKTFGAEKIAMNDTFVRWIKCIVLYLSKTTF